MKIACPSCRQVFTTPPGAPRDGLHRCPKCGHWAQTEARPKTTALSADMIDPPQALPMEPPRGAAAFLAANRRALLLAGIGACLCLVLPLVVLHWGGTADPLKKPLTLKEAEAAVLGQSTEVVMQKLGPPSRTEPLNDGTGAWWFYSNTLKGGGLLWLWINQSGKVIEVRRN